MLATDERITFSIFLYDEDVRTRLRNEKMLTGFDAGDGRRGLGLTFLHMQEEVYRIDGSLLFLCFSNAFRFQSRSPVLMTR